MLRKFLADESAATAVEYCLLSGIAGLLVVTAIGTLGAALQAKFNSIAGSL